MAFDGFQPSLFEFLEQLADHNSRPWFQENKGRYERDVLEPCLAFIRAFQPPLRKISEFFVASDRRVGGSLMRVYRDTRFSPDDSPYKTNVGIQFRHELGRDVHAPGFYVHIAPNECFLAMGMWRPDSVALGQVRQALMKWPDRWRRAIRARTFRELFTLEGGQLKRPPRGFAADHPLIEDLKRTDFVGIAELGEQDILEKRFLDRAATSFATARPFMRFLCDSVNVPF